MKRPFNVARVIKTVEYVPASAVLSEDEWNELSESNQITWGDAHHTLVTVQRIGNALGYVPDRLADLRPDFYIDLEN